MAVLDEVSSARAAAAAAATRFGLVLNKMGGRKVVFFNSVVVGRVVRDSGKALSITLFDFKWVEKSRRLLGSGIRDDARTLLAGFLRLVGREWKKTSH